MSAPDDILNGAAPRRATKKPAMSPLLDDLLDSVIIPALERRWTSQRISRRQGGETAGLGPNENQGKQPR